MLPLTLLFVVGDPNPVTAEQNYLSGLHLTHKCLHFNLREISLFCFSQYFCHCFRQDIILASKSVLYADRIHEVICIDHLWLKRGVYRAEREADSAAHTLVGTLIYKAKIAYGVRTQGFINLNIFWRTQNLASGCTHIFSNDPTHSFINETPGVSFIKLCVGSHTAHTAYKCAQLNQLHVPPCTRPFLTINNKYYIIM
ncbi:unnamed protein product [Gadus morhua 'NCC']